jgi:hypothetical protein
MYVSLAISYVSYVESSLESMMSFYVHMHRVSM